MPPDKPQESYDLYLTSGVLYVTTVWGFLVLYAMLRAQFGTRLGDLAVRASGFRVVQAAVVMSLFFLVLQIVQLPFDAYEHHIGLQYGLPVRHWDWGSWFGDWAHSYCWAVASRDGGSMRYAALPDGGWFYFWMGTTPFVVFVIFIQKYGLEVVHGLVPDSGRSAALAFQVWSEGWSSEFVIEAKQLITEPWFGRSSGACETAILGG